MVKTIERKLCQFNAPKFEALKAHSDLSEDWAADPTIAVGPIVLSERAERIKITIDGGLLRRVDRVAEMPGETRSGFVAQALRERLAQ